VDIAQERWFLVAERVGKPIASLVCKRVDKQLVPGIGESLNPMQTQDEVCAGLISEQASGILSVIALEARVLDLQRQMRRYENIVLNAALQGSVYQQNLDRGQQCQIFLPRTASGMIWLITASVSLSVNPRTDVLIAPYDREHLSVSRIQSARPMPDSVNPVSTPMGIGYVLLKKREDLEYVAAQLDPTTSDLLSGLHYLSMATGRAAETFVAIKRLLEEVFLLGCKWERCCSDKSQKYR